MQAQERPSETTGFPQLNPGYRRLFRFGKLSLGLIVPIEHYPHSPVPSLKDHLARVQLAEKLGFGGVWLRDVPFDVPTFGDAGQTFDPFVYLGYLAAATEEITLAVGSVILPLRHPAHVAKSAASVDVLSGGRLVLGVASGDRPEEYPAMNMDYETRGERFRSSMDYVQQVWTNRACFENPQGSPYGGMNMMPKPLHGRVPLMITGASQQSPDWLAKNGDGWITYPRGVMVQERIVKDWRAQTLAAGLNIRPASQSLYIDLSDDPDEGPAPIHLGFRSGIRYLREYLSSLEDIGMNHVALNLRFNRADTEETLKRLADELLGEFGPHKE